MLYPILLLDESRSRSAQYLSDELLAETPFSMLQELSGFVAYLSKPLNIYGLRSHNWRHFLLHSEENLNNFFDYADCICSEYFFRFGKTHPCAELLATTKQSELLRHRFIPSTNGMPLPSVLGQIRPVYSNDIGYVVEKCRAFYLEEIHSARHTFTKRQPLGWTHDQSAFSRIRTVENIRSN